MYILKYFIKLQLLLILIFLMYSCQEQWYLSIKDSNIPLQPVFCISKYKHCIGKGKKFYEFTIDRIDKYRITPVWTLKPITDARLKMFIYGQEPFGYEQLNSAIPLQLGATYSVCDKYQFTVNKHGSKIVYDIVLGSAN